MKVSYRTRVLSWFRYHHYSTNPAQESHSTFIGLLGKLESMADMNIDEIDADKMYELIKAAVGKLTSEQIETIYNNIKSR